MGKLGWLLASVLLLACPAAADSLLVYESYRDSTSTYQWTLSAYQTDTFARTELTNTFSQDLNRSISTGGLVHARDRLFGATSEFGLREPPNYNFEYALRYYEFGAGTGAQHLSDANPRNVLTRNIGQERAAYDAKRDRILVVSSNTLYSVEPDTGATEIIGYLNLTGAVLAYDSTRDRLIAMPSYGSVSAYGAYEVTVPDDPADWGAQPLTVTRLTPQNQPSDPQAGINAYRVTGLAYDETNDRFIGATRINDGVENTYFYHYDAETLESSLSAVTPTFGLRGDVTWLRSGLLQSDPILPGSGGGDSPFVFEDVNSGDWFDPPLTDSYIYTMTSGSVFTGILDFPTGYAGAFDISVDGIFLGSFGPGQSVYFSDFAAELGGLLFNGGVSSFMLSGIDPLVDTEDPTGFPLRLAFDTATASFTMAAPGATSNPVPEPGTALLLGLGLAGAWGYRARRRRARKTRGAG